MQSMARYGTRDLPRARPLYDAIAELVGGELVWDYPQVVGYRGRDGGMFVLGTPFAGEATVGNGAMVSFTVGSRELVDAVHAKALALGGADEGAPGVRGPADSGIYGAYFRDLDGNKLAVFCMGPQ